MGFDPRQWPAAAQPRRVTTNIDALLAENEALRREVQQLRLRLEQWERQSRPDPRGPQGRAAPQTPARVSSEQVLRWGDALSAQSGWRELRLGDPSAGTGLRGLIDSLNRRSFFPQLSLEQRLDRLVPGLGTDLKQALTGPDTRRHLAIRAAFALYGVSATGGLMMTRSASLPTFALVNGLRLVAAPAATTAVSAVTAVRRAVVPRAMAAATRPLTHRGTEASGACRGARRSRPAPDRGLSPAGPALGAPTDAIKRAHRRLVKKHHPDVGGRAEDFHRISQAYQLLVA